MKGILILVFILLGSVTLVKAQTYSFKSRDSNDRFEIQTDNNGLYCLFRISEKKAPITTFRKVFLNADLSAIDSVDYPIEGQANLIASGSDELYSFYAFYSKAAPIEKIVFIITDRLGKIQTTFFKTAVDFSSHFPKPVKKLKYIQLSFLPNTGSPGMILVEPYLTQGSNAYRGQIYALRAEDGVELWVSNAPPLSNMQFTDSLLIGMTTSYSNGMNQVGLNQIHFVDKTSGRMLKTIPFTANGQGYRTISVFTSNGRELMVAGSEFETGNAKTGRFYMSMFSLSGEKIFDRVDSATRLSTRRLHIMGHVFDPDGNLVLVGEGWKPDATRAVATTAASILLSVAVGGYVGGINTQADHKIDNVVFATLSPVDGRMKTFKSFPVGPWRQYGNLMTEGSHVLIAISNQVIIYDAAEPNTPPKPFTTLRSGENLILTPSGPIINKQERGGYVLSKLR